MKLLTKAHLDAFKKQGDTSDMSMAEIKIIVKFFGGNCTWYIYEYDTNPETNPDGIMWGFANLNNPDFAESGTVLFSELQDIRFPPFNLPIERDKYFPIGKISLKEVYNKVKGGKHV